jgi:hypothetical protein
MSSLLMAVKHMFQQWTIILSRFFNDKNFTKQKVVEQERRNVNGNGIVYHSKLEIGYAQQPVNLTKTLRFPPLLYRCLQITIS